MTLTVTTIPRLGNETLRQVWAAVSSRTEKLTDLAVREMIDGAVFGASLQLQLWDYLTSRLSAGAEGRETADALRGTLDVMELSLQTMDLVEVTAQKKPPRLDTNRADLVHLAEQRKKIAAIRDRAKSMLDFVTAPRPPIDHSKISPSSGKGLTLDEFLADL